MVQATDSHTLTDVLVEVETWEPPTVAVGVTSADGVLATYGPTDELLWFASVSKPITAYGVLLASQQGELRLDEPVEIPGGQDGGQDGSPGGNNGGSPGGHDGRSGSHKGHSGQDGNSSHDGITVRHLLAHAGGLPLYAGGPRMPVERRRSYSDWAYELLGDLVASRVGSTFEDHLDLEVFGPLGMTRTRLGGPAGHGVHGTLDDLLRFARELLAPTLLEPSLLAEATSVAFPGLDGVVPGYGRHTPNDWGLGFELKGTKTDHWTGTRLSPRTFGHFGLSGSFLWVDPDRGLAAAELADREFGPWAREAWGPFNDRLVAAVAP